MAQKLVIKLLDSSFTQLKTAVDVNNELSSININKTSYEGSTIEIKAPMTETTMTWIKQIKDSIYSENPNNKIFIVNGNDSKDFFIASSISIDNNGKNGKETLTLKGFSVEYLLKNRLNVENEWKSANLSQIIEDIITFSGFGGNLEGVKALGDEDPAKRFVPFVSLNIDLTNDISGINYSTDSTQTVSDSISDILKTYGKRMYSEYDEISKKIIIKISDGYDKTIQASGLKFLISANNTNIKNMEYRLNRSERVNVLFETQDKKVYQNESDFNIPEGLNRVESNFSLTDTDDSVKQEKIDQEFTNADDSIEKVNVSVEFDDGFEFGLGSNGLYVGDLVSVVLYREDGERVIVNDVISAMNIIVDTTKTTSNKPIYIPTIGNDSTDDDGEYMSVRQRLYYKSNKNLQKKI